LGLVKVSSCTMENPPFWIPAKGGSKTMPRIKISLNVNLILLCSKCGNLLPGTVSESRSGGPPYWISVDMCQECLTIAKKEGYAEGVYDA